MKKPKQQSVISAYFRKVGKKGGKVSAGKKTPDERKALGKLGGTARWKDHEYSEKPNSVYQRERRRRMKEAKKETEQDVAQPLVRLGGN